MESKHARFSATDFEDVVVSQQQKPGASSTNGSQCLFYNIGKQISSTCLWHSQYKPQVAIPPVELNRHARGTDKKAQKKWPNHGGVTRCSNFATGTLPCQPASARSRFTRECGVSLGVSDGICPPVRGQGVGRVSLASFLCGGFLSLSGIDKSI